MILRQVSASATAAAAAAASAVSALVYNALEQRYSASLQEVNEAVYLGGLPADVRVYPLGCGATVLLVGTESADKCVEKVPRIFADSVLFICRSLV